MASFRLVFNILLILMLSVLTRASEGRVSAEDEGSDTISTTNVSEERCQAAASSCCKSDIKPTHPTMLEAEFVTFVYGNYQPIFLLDRGRVKYHLVANVFNLRFIEILMPGDEKWIVDADEDGYIPLLFEPGSFVQVSGDGLDTVQEPQKHVHVW